MIEAAATHGAARRDVHVVAHCRTGFEGECASDLQRVAAESHAGFIREPAAPDALCAGVLERFGARAWSRALREHPPIFARSIFLGSPLSLPGNDRITPIAEMARDPSATCLPAPFSLLWLETPDSNEGKMLSGMCRRLQPLLEEKLRTLGLLDSARPALPRLHVLLTARDAAYVGASQADVGSPWPMGIPRLRMPHGAPSRSTLKLAEAFVAFLGATELEQVRAGMRAVDLGAAPGGWSWQLAQRGVRVTAVDNGALKGEVAQDPLVTHVRADGLGYRPRRPVDWMVCDIVEQPSRIAALVARWIAEGDARRCIFNLKLPMKRRYDEVMRCIGIIGDTMEAAKARYELRVRQLYHDREEVTGYLARKD